MRLLIGLVSAVALLAQPQPDAQTLLMRSGGVVLLAGTVRLEGKDTTEIKWQNGRNQTADDSFSLERAPGGRMRLEVTSPNNVMQMVADGQRVWTYFSNTHLYSQAPPDKALQNDAFRRLEFGRDPATFRDVRIEREESLPYSGKPAPCYVISAAYRSMLGFPMAGDVRRTVWIAKDDTRVLRDTWEYTSGSEELAGRVHLTTDYTVIETDVPIPDSLFVFHPPEGSTQVQTADAAAAVPVPKLGGGRPAVQHAVTAEYTPEARAAGLQGVVSLYAEVQNDGRPRNLQVMEGLGLGLDQKAVAAVKQWQFAPKEGQADQTQSILDLDVEFRQDPPGAWDVTGEAYYLTRPSSPEIQKIVNPVPVRYVAPDAAACQMESRPNVKFHIGVDGMPHEVTGSLDAATHAVESWQFQPGTVDDSPAEAEAEVEFRCTPGGMVLKSVLEVPPVYRVGGGVSAPVLLSKIEPAYSEEARVARLQGRVVLYVHISPEGRATEIRVTEPLGMGLEEHAMEAVKRWRFQPGKKAGQPVAVEATIEVNFRLL